MLEVEGTRAKGNAEMLSKEVWTSLTHCLGYYAIKEYEERNEMGSCRWWNCFGAPI